MGESEVAVVRATYESGVWRSDGDPGAALKWLAEDFEFVNPAHAVVPGVRHGHEGILAARKSLDDGFDSWRNDALSFEDAGEHVIVETSFVCVGAQSGLGFERREWHVWTVRDGLAHRVAWFHDLDDARKAAGL